MIWAVPANLKQIHDQGRHYRWPRPESCPRCRNWRVWGHGYAERYFDGFAEALRVRCYRCPACGCVITLRPESHFPRIRSPRQVIRKCLHQRLTQGRWPPTAFSPSRWRHWLSNLKRQILARLTNTWTRGVWAGFEELLLRGQTPVARVS
jgi:hypothetical protein